MAVKQRGRPAEVPEPPAWFLRFLEKHQQLLAQAAQALGPEAGPVFEQAYRTALVRSLEQTLQERKAQLSPREWRKQEWVLSLTQARLAALH
jgi:hypothetical protein